jgi:hypothetical protein
MFHEVCGFLLGRVLVDIEEPALGHVVIEDRD